ncbi:TRAP transporter small permease subunit [Hoeflea sp. CAU 1731]
MRVLVKIMNRLSNGLDLVIRVAAGVFLLTMVASIGLQVIARYVFSSPPPWTEEAARFAMVWVGLLGATVSFKAGFDPSLVKLSENVPGWISSSAKCLRGLSVILFLSPILWFSIWGPNINFARGFLSRHYYLKAETFDMSTLLVAIGVPLFVIVIFIHGISKAMTDAFEAEEKVK